MDFLFDPSLVFYLPLNELDGSAFKSKDAHGHLCTATGALWTPKGRDFDGDDDKITLPSILTSGDWSWMGWINSDAQDDTLNGVFAMEGGQVFWYGGNAGVFADKFGALIGSSPYVLADTAVVTGSWQMVGCAIEENTGTYNFYQQGMPDGSSIDADGAKYPSDPQLGARSTIQFFNGKIGEVFIYSRALTPLEFHHNYLATKWRYR